MFFLYPSRMGLCFLVLLLNSADVYIADLNGIVSPASSAYLVRAIEYAENHRAACLVLELDTPGGLDESMREITKKIESARIPVVVYVAPKGARAASAGVFILYSSHLAAMAPGTNIGAAHPVGMGGEKMDSVMVKKVTNDAVAYIRALAKEHQRNADWAEKAVRESASVDAETARQLGVCELIANSDEDLLTKIDGRLVTVRNDTVAIRVKDARVRPISMTMRERLLLILTNPNIAYILLMLGIYGLFFELQNPGMVLPGVLGGICLILGFYALHVLPVNYAGVALIFLSAIFFIFDVYAPSHGILTAGGIISLVIGSVILFDSNVPYLRVSWEVIMAVVIIITAFVVFLLTLGVRAQFKKPATGREGMIGAEGVSRTKVNNQGGTVFVHGEYWNAISERPVDKDRRVKIVEVKGSLLKVEEF